jgi:hypothetical protein
MLKVRKPPLGRAAAADPKKSVGHGHRPDSQSDPKSDGRSHPVANDGDRSGDQPQGPAGGEESRETAAVGDYAELGEHVAGVLKAANEAAARIRQEAAIEAERIAEVSRKEATTTLAEANRDADKLLFEADQRRAEANETAKATRKAADAYAGQQREEAEAHASRLIAHAEQEATQRASVAEKRHKTLEDNIDRTELRLEQLVAGLRELASRLESVVHPNGAGAEKATQSSTEQGDPTAEPNATPATREPTPAIASDGSSR